MKSKTITFDRFVRIIAGIAIAVVAYFLLRRLSDVLIPFLIAWLAAYLLYPIVCFFQYKCKIKSRAASIVVTLVLIVGICTGAAFLIIPPVIDECARVKDIIASFVSTNSTTSTLTSDAEDFIRENVNFNEISQALTVKDVSSFAKEIVPKVFSVVNSSVNALVGFICSLIAVIYMFFILMDYERMSKGFIKMVPVKHRSLIQNVINYVEKGMNNYFRGQTIIAMSVGVLFAIGFWIIGLPLAIPLGLFIGCLNLVPYLQVIGIAPSIVLALLKAHDTGESLWSVLLGVLIVFCAVQAIQDWVLTPKIMGKVTGLNAAVILLSLSIWGSLLGFVGLIIALPATTLIVSYYKRYVIGQSDNDEEIAMQDNEKNTNSQKLNDNEETPIATA